MCYYRYETLKQVQGDEKRRGGKPAQTIWHYHDETLKQVQGDEKRRDG